MFGESSRLHGRDSFREGCKKCLRRKQRLVVPNTEVVKVSVSGKNKLSDCGIHERVSDEARKKEPYFGCLKCLYSNW